VKWLMLMLLDDEIRIDKRRFPGKYENSTHTHTKIEKKLTRTKSIRKIYKFALVCWCSRLKRKFQMNANDNNIT